MDGRIWHLEWNDDFNTGIAEIDKGRRESITLISDLIEAALNMEQPEIILGTMQVALKHTQQQFVREEEYLQQLHSLGVADHAREHAFILNKFRDLMVSAVNNNGRADDLIAAALDVRRTLVDLFLHDGMKKKIIDQ